MSLPKKINLTLVTADSEKDKKMADFLVSAWREIGININLESVSSESLQKEIIPEKKFDLLLFGIDLGADPDPYPFWYSNQADTGLNITGFSSSQADKILARSQKILDEKIRSSDLANFLDILGAEYPALFLYRTKFTFGAKEIVQGITQGGVGISSADRFYNVQKWYIKTKRVGR